ncbi:PucR family transcriptional regulator [Streptomyces sp. NPDC058623]|uniref:PucR family transcriptional regulator n=1 Tax=Streptomyces sp. NPDC058623 TaxID=3346563 RepID=UPI00364B8FF8
MPLTVRDLLAIPSLRLALAAGSSGVSRAVEAAYASEVSRPSAWMEGGEVVMTTALLLGTDAQEHAEYVADLNQARAVAVVLGLGPSLPLQSVPAGLSDAAEQSGLPLLTIPEGVPLAAVTKAVFDARAAEERRLLERTLRTQRRLTAAVASTDPLEGLLRAWHLATGVAVVVCDVLGRPLGSVGAQASTVLAEAAEILEAVALRGLRGSAGGDIPSGPVQVQPLGAARLRGFVLLLGTDNPESRLLGSVLISLLSVELERRHLADEPERRRRAGLLARLFAGDLTAEHAQVLLKSAGFSTTPIRAVAIQVQQSRTPNPVQTVAPTAREEALALAADMALAVPGGLVRVVGASVETVLPDGSDIMSLLARFASGRPAGIGPAVSPQHAALSLRQAVALLSASAELARPVTASEAGSVRLLLSLGSPVMLAAFADAALAAVDEADGEGELIETLRVWLETNGSWAETSALLGLHRHTVQNRIAKIGKLTGRQMDRCEDRVDLWLALQSREQATGC